MEHDRLCHRAARLLGIALSLAVAAPVLADAPPHGWSRRAGDALDDYGRAVAVDGLGRVVVAGTFQGMINCGGDDLWSEGKGDIFVATYDTEGAHAWSRRFGGAHADVGHAVAVDAAGNVVVAGSFTGTVDFGGGALVSDDGSADIFVAKFSASGTHTWSRRFGDGGTDLCRFVAVDASGNVFAIGEFEGAVDFGGGARASAGGSDAFVAMFDADGTHRWSRRLGDADDDYGVSVAVDGRDRVIATGEFVGTADFGGGDLTGAGNDDIFLACYDVNGAHLWSRAFGNTGYDGGHVVATDAAGNVYLTGEMEMAVNFGGNDLTSAGAQDIFLAAFDAGGQHLWSRCFGDAGNDRPHALAVDAGGNVILGGFFAGTVDFGGGSLSSESGSEDIFLAGFSADGAHQWSVRFGGAQPDAMYSAALDRWGNVLTTGTFGGAVNFGGGDLASLGEGDVFIAAFGPGVADGFGDGAPRVLPSISTYPNPFNPEVTIRYAVPSPGRVEVAIYDVRGARVALLVREDRPGGAYAVPWDGRGGGGRVLGSGVYFARVTHPAGSRSCKLVLLK